jgi:hypothetical protein
VVAVTIAHALLLKTERRPAEPHTYAGIVGTAGKKTASPCPAPSSPGVPLPALPCTPVSSPPRPQIKSVGTTAYIVKPNIRAGAGLVHMINNVLVGGATTLPDLFTMCKTSALNSHQCKLIAATMRMPDRRA